MKKPFPIVLFWLINRCAPWRAKRRRVVPGRRRRGRMAVGASDSERRRPYASASDTPSSHLWECCVASAERSDGVAKDWVIWPKGLFRTPTWMWEVRVMQELLPKQLPSRTILNPPSYQVKPVTIEVESSLNSGLLMEATLLLLQQGLKTRVSFIITFDFCLYPIVA